MQKKRSYSFVLALALAGFISLSGCSSSEVSSDAELPKEDLPVVDANTDAVPSADQPPVADAQNISEAPKGDDAPPSLDAANPPPAVDAPPVADAPPAQDAVAAAPDAPPAQDVASVAKSDPSPSGSAGVYEVQKGDTLMKIAFSVYGDIYQWKKVLDDNKDRIVDSAHLVAGTQLKVDSTSQEDYYNGFEKYLIQGGDTLGTISGDVYGTKRKWRALWKQNEKLIHDPNRIFAGFFLRYSMTDEEKNEAQKLKSSKAPAPLAGTDDASTRQPSSTP